MFSAFQRKVRQICLGRKKIIFFSRRTTEKWDGSEGRSDCSMGLELDRSHGINRIEFCIQSTMEAGID